MNEAEQITSLQVPLPLRVKQKAAIVAKEKGFGTVQNAVRLWLNQFAEGDITFSFFNKGWSVPPQRLAEWDKDIKALKKEIKAGRVKGYDIHNYKEMTKDLARDE